MMTAPTDALLAGRYQMGQLLGSGGFGAVYLATDERLHRPVAIKICSTQRLPAHEAVEAAQLFQSEALTLARLRHPGLTAIWDYFDHGNDWHLVMEYVPGETLRTKLKREGGPLPQAEAVDYARQLCSVLTYLHRQQPPVVFRDLKPANIMVTPEGQLKLIDFGIARLFSPDKVADTAQFGTPGYAPPEQYGGQTEPRSDMYSLGVVLHQMLTGHNPTSSPFALPPVRALNLSIPEPLEALVTQATAYNIDDRVASAEEFCRLLNAAVTPPRPTYTKVGTRPTPATQQTTTIPTRQVWAPAPRSLPTRPASSGWGRSMMLILLLVLLLGGLATGGYLLQTQLYGLYNGLAIVGPAPDPPTEDTPLTVFSAVENNSENIYAKVGDNIQQLTQFAAGTKATQPAISPDGTRIAFSKEVTQGGTDAETRSTRYELWVMDRDGGKQRQLLSTVPLARAAAWSPDGKTLAVEIANPGNEWRDHDIAIVDVITGQQRTLVDTPYWEGGPSWSPDGQQLVYHGRINGVSCMQLFTISAQGGSPEQLTDLRNQDCSGTSSGDYWPDWSPNGSQIAFGRKLAGKEQLMLLNLATRAVQALPTGDLPAGYPRWARNGQKILFEQGKGDNVSLAILDLKTNQITQVDTPFVGRYLADWF